MSETVVIVILGLALLVSEARSLLSSRDWTRERASLLNRIAARTPAELVALERTVPGTKTDEPEPVRSGPVAIGME